ncbi:jg23589 [Pararge aegeria aegeria]|uniref:Jg23589 protein n=1 Tax=Pararge aegeria aegeria TaxID=348720 RepID=A0A8S4RPV8_9NEOP|nr:jg23589 [Pararge aegeria aegeria]
MASFLNVLPFQGHWTAIKSQTEIDGAPIFIHRKMEVFLYNSTVCRLCGEENDNGNLLYSCDENNQNLCEIINSYLPIKVEDDGELPRTICPGCTIQLEATVEFLNLIINGQKVIRELYQREREYKKSILNGSDTSDTTEKVFHEINANDGVYHAEHPVSLQVAGLERPKRKRGRPPKKPKSAEELAREAVSKSQTRETKSFRERKDDEDLSGKRRRKTPTRFKEAVQGKELERIFLEVGVIDGEESDHEMKVDLEPVPKPPVSKEPEVIGHIEKSGELVLVVKNKGRGRPKGRSNQTREECAICGLEFMSRGRYMSHVASHGPVLYRCGCGEAFATRLLFTEHQTVTHHTGRTVEPHPEAKPLKPKETETIHKKEKLVNNNTTSTPATNNLDAATQTQGAQPIPAPQVLPDLKTPVETAQVDPLKIDSNVTSDTVTEIPMQNTLEVVDNTPATKKKLKCNNCDKLFSNRQSKSLHNKAVHLGERNYACNECDARFAYPRSLAVHRVSHRRARPNRGFACDLCGKVLNHPSSVVYHKQAEHAEQRYVCGTCGKHFRHKQLLQRHQLVHSQLRPFLCKVSTLQILIHNLFIHVGLSQALMKRSYIYMFTLTGGAERAHQATEGGATDARTPYHQCDSREDGFILLHSE